MTETAGNLAFRPEKSHKFALPALRTRFSSAKNARCIVVLRQKRQFNSINLHLYHYAGNNPVRYVDPDGREDVYFIYTYKTNNEHDQNMKKSERNSINDEVKELQKNGHTVKVIENGTKSDIQNAISDPDSKIIITSGHGYNPQDFEGIQTADAGSFSPSDVSAVGKNLKTVIFENCYQGDIESKWEKSFDNKVDVVGWKGTTNTSETNNFNGWGLFDRQRKNLKKYIDEALESKDE